ncbi:hypothetical protein ACKKBF_B17895 [Auxenochlorella protothecoides x Auxenochlorella symbiontica]
MGRNVSSLKPLHFRIESTQGQECVHVCAVFYSLPVVCPGASGLKKLVHSAPGLCRQQRPFRNSIKCSYKSLGRVAGPITLARGSRDSDASKHHDYVWEPPAQAGDAENRSSELWSLQGQILADLRAQLQQEREARSLERAEWLAQMTALHEESRSLRAELLSLLGGHVAGAHDAHVTAVEAARSTKGGGAVLPASSPAAVPDDDRSETEVLQPAPTSPPMSSDQETERAPWKDDLRLALAASEDTDILSIPAENFGDYLASRRRAGKDEAAQSGGDMTPEPAVSLPTMAAQPVAQLDLGPSDPARPAAPPPGPPPLLREGDDDISWMNALHSAMAEAGYHAGEDDEEEWYFGSGTTSALLTLQACEGLEETGVADEPTWRFLLGDAYDAMVNASAQGKAGPQSGGVDPGADAGDAEPELFLEAAELGIDASILEEDGPPPPGTPPPGRERGGGGDGERWPILNEGDGGREVKAMQIALDGAGFFPGTDDMRWWQFGSSSMRALATFQACNGLPESGVCDGATWRKLLGEGSTPADIAILAEQHAEGAEDEDDLAGGQGVWLLGEQRWERPGRLTKD